MSPVFPIAGVLVALLLGRVASQAPSTTAQCTDDFKWMFNNKTQSPCLVAAYLQATCFTNGAWVVESLDPGTMYLPPDSSNVNACQCNTVTYNMLSACAACQEHGWVGFKAWVQSCPAGIIQVESYPFTVPSDTAVPNWAYIDTSSGTFNVTQAYKVSQNETSATDTESTHPGPISPGTITAIAVGAISLLLLPLLYIWLFRMRKQPASPSSAGLSTRAKPQRMKSIWLGKGDGGGEYAKIHRTPGGSGVVGSKFLSLLPGRKNKPIEAMSERRSSSFQIDKDTVIDDGGGGGGGELTPALSGHQLEPTTATSSKGHSTSSWQAFLKLNNASRQTVEQQEDIGSAVDFTFVSSNAAGNNNDDDPESDEDGDGETIRKRSYSRDPSPPNAPPGPYSYWARNPRSPHQYPPTDPARRESTVSTIYPSDSVSNLQLRENPRGHHHSHSHTPTPEEEAAVRKQLEELETLRSPTQESESSIRTEKYSPPPHRSRLPQIRSSDPVMMYPGTVRGSFSRPPPGK